MEEQPQNTGIRNMSGQSQEFIDACTRFHKESHQITKKKDGLKQRFYPGDTMVPRDLTQVALEYVEGLHKILKEEIFSIERVINAYEVEYGYGNVKASSLLHDTQDTFRKLEVELQKRRSLIAPAFSSTLASLSTLTVSKPKSKKFRLQRCSSIPGPNGSSSVPPIPRLSPRINRSQSAPARVGVPPSLNLSSIITFELTEEDVALDMAKKKYLEELRKINAQLDDHVKTNFDKRHKSVKYWNYYLKKKREIATATHEFNEAFIKKNGYSNVKLPLGTLRDEMKLVIDIIRQIKEEAETFSLRGIDPRTQGFELD